VEVLLKETEHQIWTALGRWHARMQSFGPLVLAAATGRSAHAAADVVIRRFPGRFPQTHVACIALHADLEDAAVHAVLESDPALFAAAAAVAAVAAGVDTAPAAAEVDTETAATAPAPEAAAACFRCPRRHTCRTRTSRTRRLGRRRARLPPWGRRCTRPALRPRRATQPSSSAASRRRSRR
jgi:hypothetical protein